MLRFQPIYKAVPWGGTRLATDMGRRTPPGNIGEAWELVEIPGNETRVVRGEHEGKGLGELWRAGALGGSATGGFPFLVKWLDTRDKLSVQVHPDETAVKRLGTGAPKTEAWLVAEVSPGAVLMVGHYPGLDPATLRTAAQGGTIAKWLYEIRPRLGDLILIPAGTLHAIGGGLLLLEVQQPSDTTFRVYDWGRLDAEGRLRTLHVDEACQSVAYARSGPPRAERNEVRGPSFVMRVQKVDSRIEPGQLRVIVAHSGPAMVAGERGLEKLAWGDVVVAEPADGRLVVTEGPVALLTEPVR